MACRDFCHKGHDTYEGEYESGAFCDCGAGAGRGDCCLV
jgi:hypothetical protein